MVLPHDKTMNSKELVAIGDGVMLCIHCGLSDYQLDQSSQRQNEGVDKSRSWRL